MYINDIYVGEMAMLDVISPSSPHFPQPSKSSSAHLLVSAEGYGPPGANPGPVTRKGGPTEGNAVHFENPNFFEKFLQVRTPVMPPLWSWA